MLQHKKTFQSRYNKLLFLSEYWTSYFISLELHSAISTTRLRLSKGKDYFSLLVPEDHRKTSKNWIAGDLSSSSHRSMYSKELTTILPRASSLPGNCFLSRTSSSLCASRQRGSSWWVYKVQDREGQAAPSSSMPAQRKSAPYQRHKLQKDIHTYTIKNRRIFRLSQSFNKTEFLFKQYFPC